MRAIKVFLNICVYSYVLAVLCAWAIMWFSGDKWWFGTVLLYGPRWIYFYPMIVLVPATLIWQRRCLWTLGLTAILIAWPIMGFNLPLKSKEKPGTVPLRVMTYNIDRWNVSAENFSILLDEVQADIVAVQECAPARWKLPPQWFVKRAGTSLVVSRFPVTKCEISKRPPDVNGVYCVIDTPGGKIGFACVDLLTPRRALDNVLDEKKIFDFSQVDKTQRMISDRWDESNNLHNWIRSFPEEKKIIAGDFNLTVDSPIYRKIWSNYSNAFNKTGFGYGYSKPTKINIFKYSARVDHILSTPGFNPLTSGIGPDYGSDHLPLIADFCIINSSNSGDGNIQ